MLRIHPISAAEHNSVYAVFPYSHHGAAWVGAYAVAVPSGIRGFQGFHGRGRQRWRGLQALTSLGPQVTQITSFHTGH